MEKYDVKFKKRLGQNFLKNVGIVEKIVRVADIGETDLGIEVGPGGAIMTCELARKSMQVLAYEIDQDLKDELNSRLSSFSNVKILFKDFLDANIREDISRYNYKNVYFVSNVPYYITTPIILKLINSKINFKKIVMMVQKEVGDRFSTTCGKREYGSITVLLNYFYDVKREFFVSRKEFIPEPNVDSVVISFTEKEERLTLKDFAFFERLVRDSFQFKRKNIKNNLKSYDLRVVENVLNSHGFDLSVRAEDLSYEIFVELANNLL